MRKYQKIFITILIFLTLILLIAGIDIIKEDIFNFLKEQRTLVHTFIDNNTILSYFLFFLLTIIFVNTPIPLAAITKLIGGFMFGLIGGTIINTIATSLSSLVGFYGGRYFVSEEKYNHYKRYVKKIESEFHNNAFGYLMVMRLSVVFPFFLVNILAGLSRKVSLKTYLGSTFLSVFPVAFLYAYGGDKLATINSLGELFTLETTLFFGLVICFIVISILLKNIISKKRKKKIIS